MTSEIPISDIPKQNFVHNHNFRINAISNMESQNDIHSDLEISLLFRNIFDSIKHIAHSITYTYNHISYISKWY